MLSKKNPKLIARALRAAGECSNMTHNLLRKRINQYLTNRRCRRISGRLSITAQQVVETLSKFPKVGSGVTNTQMLLLDYSPDDPLCTFYATRHRLKMWLSKPRRQNVVACPVGHVWMAPVASYSIRVGAS